MWRPTPPTLPLNSNVGFPSYVGPTAENLRTTLEELRSASIANSLVSITYFYREPHLFSLRFPLREGRVS
jgi:hypothetical protein